MITNWFDQLNHQRQVYVLKFCQNPGNVAAAARAAGIEPKTAYSWNNTTEIKGAIEQKMRERVERLEIDGDWVLLELLQMYNADVAEIYNPATNTLLPVHEWPEHWRKSSVGIKTREIFDSADGVKMKSGEVIDVKLTDKKGLLELVGKHINVRAFTEQIVTATETELTERLARGRQRMNARTAGELKTELEAVVKPVNFL